MSIQHTTNTSMHHLLNVNQNVDSTHNEHFDSTHNQHVNPSVSKGQSTCRLNTSTNTSMHLSVNGNHLVCPIHQLIVDCASLHRKSIHHSQCSTLGQRDTNFNFKLLWIETQSLNVHYGTFYSKVGRVSWSVF